MNAYEQLRADRPELFRNLPGGLEILTHPADAAAAAAAGDGPVGIVHQDSYVTLLRDPVRFPDGRLGTYVRLLDSGQPSGCAVLPLLGGEVVLIELFRHATRSWELEVVRGFGTPGLTDEANAAKEIAEELGAVMEEWIPLGRVTPDSGFSAQSVALGAARIGPPGRLGHGEGIRRALAVPFVEAEHLVRTGRITDGFTIAVLSHARLAGLCGD